MLNKIIQVIINLLILENEISEEDIKVYYFGLECIILKILHYISYIIIGVSMDAIMSLLISACAFMPLRSNAGGYHAKTRIRCYIFSCIMVVCMCVGNRTVMHKEIYVIALIIYDIIITIFSPVDSYSNILNANEKKRQKRKTLIILVVFNILVLITMYKNINIFRYLINGIGLVAFLLMLGMYKRIITTREVDIS